MQGSIHHLITKNGALSEEDTEKFGKQVLHGLIYLHENDIIHRDIKGKYTTLSIENMIMIGNKVSKF